MCPKPTLTGLSGIGRVGWLAAIPVWCENEKMRTAREYLRRDWLCFANTWVCLYQSCHNAPYAYDACRPMPHTTQDVDFV